MAKLKSLTDAGPDWPQLSAVTFDPSDVNKLSFVCASQKKYCTGSSRFASEAVVSGISRPSQTVAGSRDSHSLEFF